MSRVGKHPLLRPLFSGRRKRKSVGGQALSLAKKNRRFIKGNLEYHPTPILASTVFIENVAFAAAPNLNFMTMSGNDLETMVKSIRIRAIIQANQTSTLVDSWRVDLIRDKMPAGGSTATALLMYDDATPECVSFLSFNQKSRFEILRTWIGAFHKNVDSHFLIDEYVKINKKSTTKSDGSWTDGNMMTNSYWLVFWSDSAANFPTIRARFRIIIEGEED